MCVGGRGGWRTGWGLDSSEVCPHPGWFGVHCNREENRLNRFIKRLGEMWEIWSALCSYLCSLCWDRSEGKAWIHQEGASPLQGGTGTWIQSHLLNVGWEKSIRTINVLRGDIYNCRVHEVPPRLCRCPFLRLDGGRGGGGGGGGMRLDSSVEGERAGGAGGGASRPTPVTMGDSSGGVRGVSDIEISTAWQTHPRDREAIFIHNSEVRQLPQFQTYTLLEKSQN